MKCFQIVCELYNLGKLYKLNILASYFSLSNFHPENKNLFKKMSLRTVPRCTETQRE